jgi:hypothetical protein
MDSCSDQKCDSSEYSFFCTSCSQQKCHCAKIENTVTKFKLIADKSVSKSKKLPISKQILRAKNQFKWEILDAKVLLRSFIRPLPANSTWKQRYSDDPEEIKKLEQEFYDSYMLNNKSEIDTGKIERVLQTPDDLELVDIESDQGFIEPNGGFIDSEQGFEEPLKGILSKQEITDVTSSYIPSSVMTKDVVFEPHPILGMTNLTDDLVDFLTDLTSDSDFIKELERINKKSQNSVSTPVIPENNISTIMETNNFIPESDISNMETNVSNVLVSDTLETDNNDAEANNDFVPFSNDPFSEENLKGSETNLLHSEVNIIDTPSISTETPSVSTVSDSTESFFSTLSDDIKTTESADFINPGKMEIETLKPVSIKKSLDKNKKSFESKKTLTIGKSQFKNQDTYTLLLKLHRRYLMSKYLSKHPDLKARIGDIKGAEPVLNNNPDFLDYISKPINQAFRYNPERNVDTRPYRILRNYYTFILKKNLSSPKQFRDLVKRLQEVSSLDADKFEEIPFSDFTGNIPTERDIAVENYKEYWDDRFEKLSKIFESDSEKLLQLENSFQLASTVWTQALNLEELGLDPNLAPTEASINSMEGLTNSFVYPSSTNSFVDPNLVVSPSFIPYSELTPQTIADGAMILKLVSPLSANKNFLKRIESRWAQILVSRSKLQKTFPVSLTLSSPEYTTWILEQFKTNPMPSTVDVLLAYYTEIKNLKIGTMEFAEAIIQDYERLYAETKTPRTSITPIPPAFFPKSEEGDEVWKKYLRMFGHLNDYENVLDKDKQQFLDNVSALRNEVHELRLSQTGKSEKRNVDQMPIIELIKEKIKRTENGLPLKILRREFPRRVARQTMLILGDYNPEAIEPLQLKDFVAGESTTSEEIQEYKDYLDNRFKMIRDYERKNKAFARKKPASPALDYFKLSKMH